MMAKWPNLVPASVCCTPIIIQFENGIQKDGSPKKDILYTGKCNYSEKSKQVLNAQRQMIQLQATALLNGDIAPGKDISGEVVINNGEITRRIYSASRGRNPDGTVNFTQLELI